jgi:hypothetical protein
MSVYKNNLLPLSVEKPAKLFKLEKLQKRTRKNPAVSRNLEEPRPEGPGSARGLQQGHTRLAKYFLNCFLLHNFFFLYSGGGGDSDILRLDIVCTFAESPCYSARIPMSKFIFASLPRRARACAEENLYKVGQLTPLPNQLPGH